jgi:hypothetical protein
LWRLRVVFKKEKKNFAATPDLATEKNIKPKIGGCINISVARINSIFSIKKHHTNQTYLDIIL